MQVNGPRTRAFANLQLRPGITLREITCLLTAVADGLQMRYVADPDMELDDDGQKSLLGKAVLAFVAACVDSGDGRSLEDLVRDITFPHSTDGRQ